MSRSEFDECILESERGSENDSVAVGDEVFNGLNDLRTFGNVLFVGGLNRVTEGFLRSKTAFVVSLGPATIVGRSDVHPSSLQRAFFGCAVNDWAFCAAVGYVRPCGEVRHSGAFCWCVGRHRSVGAWCF